LTGHILVARPLWPVLGRLGNLLSRRGYSVETAGSWSALLAEPGRRTGLAAVLLGEYGSVAEEEETLLRFRKDAGPCVPVLLIGGRSAVSRTRRFRDAGVDMVFAADLSEGEILDRAMPLLAYGEMYRKSVLSGKEFSDLAMRDGLTGLPDRRRFSLDLECSAEMARRIGRPLSCILMDIDGLRGVNDAYGKVVGDSVVRQFGRVLTGAKRRYDAVARLGGDEFAWLLLGVGGDDAVQAASRAHRVICGSIFNGGHEPVSVTATFGVASLSPGVEWNAQDLVENADRALYWGKESGKNMVRFYPPGKEVVNA
jgi:diguanylate cyclase (GGDEF)-like protein